MAARVGLLQQVGWPAATRVGLAREERRGRGRAKRRQAGRGPAEAKRLLQTHSIPNPGTLRRGRGTRNRSAAPPDVPRVLPLGTLNPQALLARFATSVRQGNLRFFVT